MYSIKKTVPATATFLLAFAFSYSLLTQGFLPFLFKVNLEYLGRVVFKTDGVLYPDSLVGTDSHTTMINGLGILGWGKSIIYTWLY